MISVQEFARRLSSLGPTTLTSDDIEDLADAAGVRIDPARGIDADQAQRMLDHISPAVTISGAAVVATTWPPPESARPIVAPIVFSSPGAVDAPSDPPARPRRAGQGRTGQGRTGQPRTGRSDSRRSGH